MSNAACEQAKVRCPELFEAGSLRFAEFYKEEQPDTASMAILRNWETRCSLFGDRAYAALKDALSEDDVKVLLTGVVALLTHGHRRVLCYDPSRGDQHSESLERVWFLLLDRLAESAAEVTLLHIGPTQLRLSMQPYSALLRCLPIRLRSLYLLSQSDENGAATVTEMDLQVDYDAYRMRRLSLQVVEDLASLPQALDLPSQCVPVGLGGSWTYERDWKAWLNQQLSLDCKLPAAVSSQDPVKRVFEELENATHIDKVAFMEAKTRCPELIERESHPRRFLWRHHNNIDLALEALAFFWQKRKELFGDRAFLAMDMTGDGALTTDDTKFIRCGALVRLPNDERGRPVICLDRSRFVKEFPGFPDFAKLRCLFYLSMCSAYSEIAHTEGLTLIRCMQATFVVSPNGGTLDPKGVVESTGLRFRATPFLFRPPNASASRLWLQTAIPAVTTSMVHLKGHISTYIVDPDAKEPPKDLLEEHCLTRAQLPQSIGGDWSYETDWAFWLEHQESLEKAIYKKQPCLEATAKPNLAFDSDVESAIAELPLHAKRAYLEAKEQAPTLVEKETGHFDFFALTVDPAMAARRMTQYWQKRKELFGDRVLLPLAQHGEGALNKADIEIAGSGVFSTFKDRSGRGVLFFDAHNALHAPSDALQRVALYMLSIASEFVGDSSNGIILLLPIESAGDFEFCNLCLAELMSIMPIQVAALHVVCCPSEKSSPTPQIPTSDGESLVIPALEIVAHQLLERGQAACRLESFGLGSEVLPVSLGGNWGVQQATEWQELRTRFEWDLPPASNHRMSNLIFDFSRIPTVTSLSAEEKAERARRMDVLHSRRKRERNRIELQVVQEQIDALRKENAEALREAIRLEGLLASARQEIFRHESAVFVATANRSVGASQPYPSLPTGRALPASALRTAVPLPLAQLTRADPLIRAPSSLPVAPSLVPEISALLQMSNGEMQRLQSLAEAEQRIPPIAHDQLIQLSRLIEQERLRADLSQLRAANLQNVGAPGAVASNATVLEYLLFLQRQGEPPR